jgi:hypothetical protein
MAQTHGARPLIAHSAQASDVSLFDPFANDAGDSDLADPFARSHHCRKRGSSATPRRSHNNDSLPPIQVSSFCPPTDDYDPNEFYSKVLSRSAENAVDVVKALFRGPDDVIFDCAPEPMVPSPPDADIFDLLKIPLPQRADMRRGASRFRIQRKKVVENMAIATNV